MTTSPVPSVSRGPRRVVDIERVLAWTYGQEMPKGIPSAGPFMGRAVPRYRNMFDCYDNPGGSGSYGPAGLPEGLDAPHPDALRVHEAVERLSSLDVTEMDASLGHDAPVDMDPRRLVSDAFAFIAGDVQMFARLGARPALPDAPRPQKTMIRGQIAVTHPKTRHGGYPDDAACPLTYDPRPETVAQDRAKYLAWWAALEHLAAELADALETIKPTGPAAAREPWNGDVDLGRILAAPGPAPKVPEKVQRPLAGPVPKQSPAGPVRKIDPATGKEAA